METTTETTVVDHGDRLTVFLPEQAGVDVYKADNEQLGTLFSCELHGFKPCRHIRAAHRHMEDGGELLTWQDAEGRRHPIACDWKQCFVQAADYVLLDSPVGPYDKATLCGHHKAKWRAAKGNGNRQDNLDLRHLLG